MIEKKNVEANPDQIRNAIYEKLRTDFSFFIKYAFKITDPNAKYLHNWHIDLMADYLLACQRREIKRLIINIPPRYMKSICVSVAFPAWLMGHDPTIRIMASSYGKDLSLQHSADCLNLMKDDLYLKAFPKTILDPNQQAKAKFSTTKRGYRMATSSLARYSTGAGGNFLIVDDPHSAMDVVSDKKRKSQNLWFDNSFSTRLNNKKEDVIIVVMQRLHEDDLTGHLLEGKEYTHLKIPVEAERTMTYSIGKKEYVFEAGTTLHPARQNKDDLRKEEKTLRDAYDGQYMQEPVGKGGGIIQSDWFRYWPADVDQPRLEYVLQSYDTAFTEKTTNDPTACTVWGIFNRAKEGAAPEYGVMLVDAWHDYMNFPKLRDRAMQDYKTLYGINGKKVGLILIEKKGSGISLIQELKIAGLPIRAYLPTMDKIARANAVSHIIEAGKVWLPESKYTEDAPPSWAAAFLREVTFFPKAKHDDYVDSMTQALAMLEHMEFLELSSVSSNDPDGEEEEVQIMEENPYSV